MLVVADIMCTNMQLRLGHMQLRLGPIPMLVIADITCTNMQLKLRPIPTIYFLVTYSTLAVG